MHVHQRVNVHSAARARLTPAPIAGRGAPVTEATKTARRPRPAKPDAPATAPRTRKAEQRAATTEQILDAAEELFSQHGLYGVTLKDVAKRIGVHHTLLNYYYADKKALFDAVFARRAVVTSQRRMDALDAYERAAGDKPTAEGALRAFLDTDLDLYIEGGDGWRNYAKLGAQVANTPAWGADLMDAHFDPVVLRLIGLLKKALPGCSETDIFWGYHFVSGALMLTLARTGRIDKLSGGLARSDDFVAVKEHMAAFMAGGFEEICRRGRGRPG
jgi:AcrR family transcriptional regulator